MFEVSYDRPLEKKPNLVGFNDDDVWTIGPLVAEKTSVMQSVCTSRRTLCVKFVPFTLMVGWGRGNQTLFYPKMEKYILLPFGCFTWGRGVKWTSHAKDR